MAEIPQQSIEHVDGLLKLLYPNREAEIPDEDIEWAIRLALECRRRVKEQQKRIGSAEFRNTHFSYTMGEDGVERFVPYARTPERRCDWDGPTSAWTSLGYQPRRAG